MIKAVLLSVLILFAPNVFALETYSVKEHGAVQATISAHELSRIAVEQDRVCSIYGLEGAYELKHDPEQGVLYIKPSLDYLDKTFTVYIATEKHHNYVLHLTPKEQLGDTVLLQHQELKAIKATESTVQQRDLSELSNQTIIKRLTLLRHGRTLAGSKATSLRKMRPVSNGFLQVQPLYQYRHGKILSTVYCITNQRNQAFSLSESAFYYPGDRAIALSDTVIPPHGQVYLYKGGQYA